MSYITKYDASYLKDEANGIVITMMYAWYANDVISDGMGAVDGTNRQWESTGARVAILNTDETKIAGKAAIKQRGKIIMGGEEHEYMDVVIAKVQSYGSHCDGTGQWSSLKTVMQRLGLYYL